MKRRPFLRSVFAALASMALAQSIGCAKIDSFVEKKLIGWTYHTTREYPGGGEGWGKAESFPEDGRARRVVHNKATDWIMLENWDGTFEPIVELPKIGDGRTLTFQTIYG